MHVGMICPLTDVRSVLDQASYTILMTLSVLQLDKGTKSVETNNQKLAGVLTRVRSQRNFCIDIILIIVLLAVAGYIYTLFN